MYLQWHSQLLPSSSVLPGRAILEELILRIALAAKAIFFIILPALLGVYCKIYPPLYWDYIFQYTPVELDLYKKIFPS